MMVIHHSAVKRWFVEKYTPIPYFQVSSPLLKQKRNYVSIDFLKESMPTRSCWHKVLSQNVMLTYPVSLSDVMYIEADV